MSEPLFVPGEVALIAHPFTCNCGCTKLVVNDEVTILRIVDPWEIPPGTNTYGHICYAIDTPSKHGKLGVIEPFLKKKPGNEPAKNMEAFWSRIGFRPTRIKETA